MNEPAKVGAVMVDCTDIDAMVVFWGDLLGLDVRARYPEYVFMSRVSDGGPALAFQRVPELRAGKNRIHLDLTADDPEAFIAHVVELGGTRVEDHQMGDFHWTVLADLEGNVFCVTKTH